MNGVRRDAPMIKQYRVWSDATLAVIQPENELIHLHQ